MVVEAGVGFTGAGEAEAVSTVAGDFTAGVACARAGEADLEEGLFRRLLRATQDHAVRLLLLCARGAASLRGPATIFPGLAVISRAEISALEIPPRRPLPSPTASGIPLAAKLESADPLAGSRQPGPQATVAASTSRAGIARWDPPAQCAAFRDKAAKSGRTLPPREMLFPGRNRFLRFTIRSAVPSLRVPGSGRIPRFPRLRDLPEGQTSWAIGVFRVA